jgi:tRNA-splicing ligase RtcB
MVMNKINMFTTGVTVDDNAMKQINNVASMPFVKSVAVMPDAHWGMGATVGSVIGQEGVIIPAAVGVDIGCGMQAVKTSLNAKCLPDSLFNLRCEIEKMVPHGRSNDGGSRDVGAWGNIPDVVERHWVGYLEDGFNRISDKHKKIKKCNSYKHLGTLGTGNHFIEICLDKDENVWVMLHSGSRGVGNRIGTYFIEKAKEEMKRWYVNVPDIDLSYLPHGSKYFDDYISAVNWAQKYAHINRNIMMFNTISAMQTILNRSFDFDLMAVDCHHNYVSLEKHFGKNLYVTRKGAVSAKEGELGIIPGSMGAKSFIVKGKGCKSSMNSCSHGAGRVLSRKQAKEMFTKEDLINQTAGVECRKDESVIDEIPSAYKEIDAVMAAQNDLVEVVYELRQILCVKG